MTWLDAHPWIVAWIILAVLAALVIGGILNARRGARDQHQIDQEIDQARAKWNPEPSRRPYDAADARTRAQADIRRQMGRDRGPLG